MDLPKCELAASCGRRTCPFSVMLGYIALLGRSLCGGRSINNSRLCLYLSGSDGDPTGEKGKDLYDETKKAEMFF